MKNFDKRGLLTSEELIFQRSRKGRTGFSYEPTESAFSGIALELPEKYRRTEMPALPEVSEMDVIRHFTRLSHLNYSLDHGFYPLGSCTMKYNPRINEETCRIKEFLNLHPAFPDELCQGTLELMYQLAAFLAEIGGFSRVTLQPAAGAHGEYTALRMIRAYHSQKRENRTQVLIPDSAHGTNPASCSLNQYQVVQINSTDQGRIDVAAVQKTMDSSVAAIMITNPNTVGVFENEIQAICEIVHGKGGLVYCDGANLNAYMGYFKPGQAGIDAMHYNLHKTFSTPHGGGGPGAGPVGVVPILEPFLPIPIIEKGPHQYFKNSDRPDTIGKVRSFYGNIGILIRAYTYILEMGKQGLKRASELAVLNANYLKKQLAPYYHVAFTKSPVLHEVIFSDKNQAAHGVKTLDIAKRLMDYGFHPPTIYFPLIVNGAIMVEPTETESKEELDRFIQAMIEIAKECETDPEIVKSAPHQTPVKRLDEATACRKPDLVYKE